LDRPDRRGLFRRCMRSPDVRTAPLLGVTASPQWNLAGLQRIRGDFWLAFGNLGVFAAALVSCAVCSGRLYHRRALVHGIDIIREPGCFTCEVSYGYFQRDSTC